MTSQPLVATVCVDYLSHPFSAEHLLVCYQQITRQIAHAPVSAKDAAISFQHPSQTLLELVGAHHHHQNLSLPSPVQQSSTTRPAAVGCQAQLRRMQNALWRRSSQSSLAKDVALVRPETLNWQKECDVLWLYGPLYELGFLQSRHQPWQDDKLARSRSRQASLDSKLALVHAHLQEQRAPSPMDPLTAATITTTTTTTTTQTTPTATTSTNAAVATTATDTTTTTTTTTIMHKSNSVSGRHADIVATDLVQNADTNEKATRRRQQHEGHISVSVADITPAASPSLTSTDTETNKADSSAKGRALAVCTNTTPDSSDASAVCGGNGSCRPQKSALKRGRTRGQVFEELRLFLRSEEYQVLSRSLVSSAYSDGHHAQMDGTQSAPLSPISSPILPLPSVASSPALSSAASPSLVFAPTQTMTATSTKYHFRSVDHRRRASFPKSTSHPARLEDQGHLNMGLMQMPLSLSLGMSLPMPVSGRGADQGMTVTCPTTPSTETPSIMMPGKQLRFSLEVQELVFLPSSPPFRISRAKPTRAHSDPAIQTVTNASYIAPSYIHIGPGSNPAMDLQTYRQYQQHQHQQYHYRDDGASAPTAEQNRRSGGMVASAGYGRTLPLHHPATGVMISKDDDQDSMDSTLNDEFSDEYMFVDCREDDEAEGEAEAHGDDMLDENDEDEELEDEALDGALRKRSSSTSASSSSSPTTLPVSRMGGRRSRRGGFSGATGATATTGTSGMGKNGRRWSSGSIVAQDLSTVAGSGNAVTTTEGGPGGVAAVGGRGPGMLWHVYTAVHGVKELIAWYGYMVYHSSSL